MPRPQPAPSASLKRSRPEDHVFEPAGRPAPDAGPADEPSHTDGDATSRTAAPPQEVLVKFSIRVPAAAHRHIKVAAAQNDMTIQDLSVTAIREYLERLGHPLP